MKNIASKSFSKKILGSIFVVFLGTINASAANLDRIKTSCKQNIITIPSSFSEFELEVIDWIKHCVKSKTKKNGKPVKREIKLVKNNKSLLDTWNKVNNMQGVEVGIVAKYKGKNKVKRIVFSPRGYDSKPISFEGDVILGVSILKKRWAKKDLDIKKGEKIFGNLTKITKKNVRKIVKMPSNPTGTPSFSEVLKLLKEGHPKNLAKYTVGGLIDVLTANQSKSVSAKRRVLYENYSEGVAKILDPDYRVSERDKKGVELAFYKLGVRSAKKIKPIKRHQLRVFLIESNRTYGLKGYNPIEGSLSYFQSKYYGGLYQKAMMNIFSKSDYRYR